MKIKRIAATAALAGMALGVAGGLSACSTQGDGTVSSKFKCAQLVNGKAVTAWCIQDSNGNNFYVSYLLYQQILIGQSEDRYAKPSYWANTSHEPSDSEVPAEDHAVSHSVFGGGGDDGDGGGEHGGFSGGHGGGGR
jgi:hypothetical protein